MIHLLIALALAVAPCSAAPQAEESPEVVFWFTVVQPGTYAVVRAPDGSLVLMRQVDAQPEPSPDPQPPPVPPVPGKLLLIVVEEKTDQPRPSFAVTHSLLVEDWLRQNGHRIERLDPGTKDNQGAVPPNRARFLDPPALPYIYFADAETERVLGTCRPPETAQELLDLAKQYAGVK